MLGLSREELAVFRRLSTPIKIQDFLDTLAVNWEKKGETNMSPRRVLREGKAHCIEGAFLAAAALWLNGEEPWVLELKVPKDVNHVVTLYRRNGCWGAISKTNHAALRFRDPVYRTVRELVMSYFHECTVDATGFKALRGYAGPISMKRWGTEWITSEEDLYHIAEELYDAPSKALFPRENERLIRPADGMELRAGCLTEWKKSDKRT